MVEGLGLNSTVVAQIFNFLMLIIFMFVPIAVLIYLFSRLNGLSRRIAKIGEVLVEIKD